MVDAFPLTWPEGWPRVAVEKREAGQFRTSLAGALDNVEGSLRAFGRDSGKPVSGIVLSSNITLGKMKPDDPGVAAWFLWDGEQRCIPVDRYKTVEANLQAIHHVLEARRTELRHGTLALVRATFRGFTPLLPPPGAKRPWREVMERAPGERVTHDIIEACYRRLASIRHPDKPGGSHDAMAELNRARDEALKEIDNG
ncbi:J domain-containing protein [Ancylobacter amanitiformis]|uniref:Molecular chaperone DnaJ n=1 Tax=Ancylobacter amanitiformis TaxID=217069 RepID=A0ABU0LQG3_9HYPH|nr:J domain-containing protein [Ancylobacter amanitiformis]MDQ0510949.1 hypothetical protein [Ancylobacter amanitiformis]